MSEQELYQSMSDKFDRFDKLFRFGVWITMGLVGAVAAGAVWVITQELTDKAQWDVIKAHTTAIDKREDWSNTINLKLQRIEDNQLLMSKQLDEIGRELKK